MHGVVSANISLYVGNGTR